VKHITRSLSLLSLPLLFAASANAQSNIDVHFGGGMAWAKSSGQQIDTFNNGTPYTTPSMQNSFLGGGGEVMFTPQFGAGAEFNWQIAKSDYAGLQVRPLFYDFNGVWHPNPHNKRYVFEARAGLGGTSLHFSNSSSTCDPFTGCSSFTNYAASSNHFQLHMGVAANIYLTSKVFFRPELDAHWVNNFFQYGSNWVPRASLAIGYTFGER